MSNRDKAVKAKQVVTLFGILWLAGLVLAGSEGPYMPYLNILGSLMFLKSSLVLGRWLPLLDQKGNGPISSMESKKSAFSHGSKIGDFTGSLPLSHMNQGKLAL